MKLNEPHTIHPADSTPLAGARPWTASTAVPPEMRKINWVKSLPFFGMHLAMVAALFVPFGLPAIAWCAGGYVLRMFAITAGFHRYFAHRSYKLGRAMQLAMAFLGGTAVQKGALWWAAHHRVHHRNSDLPTDVHSPLQDGFGWSHWGWILSDAHEETHWPQISDLAKFPELVFLNRFHLIPGVLYAIATFALGGWTGFVWGFVVSTVLVWHGTFVINSLAHVFGSRRYVTTDTSRNNLWLALVTLGEGWHNNHHCYMSSARQGFYWWELDLSYYALRGLSILGLARDLKQPPLHLLEGKRLDRGAMDRIPTRPVLIAR